MISGNILSDYWERVHYRQVLPLDSENSTCALQHCAAISAAAELRSWRSDAVIKPFVLGRSTQKVEEECRLDSDGELVCWFNKAKINWCYNAPGRPGPRGVGRFNFGRQNSPRMNVIGVVGETTTRGKTGRCRGVQPHCSVLPLILRGRFRVVHARGHDRSVLASGASRLLCSLGDTRLSILLSQNSDRTRPISKQVNKAVFARRQSKQSKRFRILCKSVPVFAEYGGIDALAPTVPWAPARQYATKTPHTRIV